MDDAHFVLGDDDEGVLKIDALCVVAKEGGEQAVDLGDVP